MGIHYFLIFALKIDCGGSNVYNVLSKIKKIVKKFQMKIVIFTGMKNCCRLHGRVFVMY